MATAVIPAHAELSEAAEYRNRMYSDAITRLQHIAHRGLHVHGMENDEFIMVCIQVDSPWRDIVEQLMPRHDWQAYRDQGMEPIARGSAMWPLCEVIAERLPDIIDAIMEKPSKGMVKVIVLSVGGGTVYEVEPKPEFGNC